MTPQVGLERTSFTPKNVDYQYRSRVLQALATVCLISISLAANAQEVITNPSVESNRISVSTLRAMFGMRLRNWTDGMPITVFVLQTSNPAHVGFTKNVLKMFPHQLQRSWDRLVFSGTGQAPTIVKSMDEMKMKVASTPGAVGYIGRDNLDDTIKVLIVY